MPGAPLSLPEREEIVRALTLDPEASWASIVRPHVIEDRSQVRHWEVDKIIGARNRSSLLTFTERVTRYAMAITIPEGYDAPATLAGLVEDLDQADWPAPVGDLRPGPGMDRVGDPRRDLRHRCLVLRPALAMATRPDRE